jgi:ABC-type uncharacterized transport system ATPase subunit
VKPTLAVVRANADRVTGWMLIAAGDHVYCLESGELIADGRADVVRNHLAVIRAYLGDEPIVAAS